MRVFVAGATGVIGRYLVPGLVTAGHEVTGSTLAAIRHLEEAVPKTVWTEAYEAAHVDAA